MYNKLRTIQKMLRTKILELEKIEKKYNKLSKKNQELIKENESIKIAFDLVQEENLKLKEALNNKPTRKSKVSKTRGVKRNASSTKPKLS